MSGQVCSHLCVYVCVCVDVSTMRSLIMNLSDAHLYYYYGYEENNDDVQRLSRCMEKTKFARPLAQWLVGELNQNQ